MPGVLQSSALAAVTSTSTPQLFLNTGLTVQASRITLNTRDYLVAPGVLVVAGVLNGALVPEDALVADAWNSIPVTINHPRDADGTPLSARSPEVMAAVGIGSLYHARLGQGQRQGQAVRSLHAELWLDVAQVETLGGEALQAMQMLEAQRPLEVSTGFYAQSLPQLGTFYGVPYTEILFDLSPDHLALLPNAIGACSWDNGGCGAPRVCEQQVPGCDALSPCAACAAERTPMAAPPAPTPTRWQAFVQMLRQFVHDEPLLVEDAHSVNLPASTIHAGTIKDATALHVSAITTADIQAETLPTALVVEATDNDTREALYAALAREMGTDYTYTYIDSIDMVTQTFIYHQGERLVQRGWTLDSAGILMLEPNVREVQRDTRFLTVPDTTSPAADLTSDSNQDMPNVMTAFGTTPRCTACSGFLDTRPDAFGVVPGCPACGNPATPTPMSQEETLPMSTLPTPSPVAIRARVNNLITTKQYGWAERDRSLLEALPEATLIRLESQPILMPPPEPTPLPEPPKTAEDAIAGMPVHLQDMFTQMYRDHQGRRQAALAILIAHTSCPFGQDELQEMSVEKLEKLVAMGAGVEYSGKGLPAPRIVPVEQEAPPPPPNTMERVLERQRAQGLRN